MAGAWGERHKGLRAQLPRIQGWGSQCVLIQAPELLTRNLVLCDTYSTMHRYMYSFKKSNCTVISLNRGSW